MKQHKIKGVFMKILMIIWIILFSFFAFAEDILLNNNELTVNVLSSDEMTTVIEYNIGKFGRTAVEINGEVYYKLNLQKESETFLKGYPELPKITRSR